MNILTKLSLLLLFVSQTITAQQSAVYLGQNQDYDKAVQLYKDQGRPVLQHKIIVL